jgi:hypothetical protein
MEIINAQHISPIPYISHAYDGLLAHERRKAHGDHQEINRVHLKISIVRHNKKEDQTKFQ